MKTIRRRGDLRSQDGFTLPEMLVASGILVMAVVMFTTILASVQSAVARQQVRSANNDNIRLALENMDRLVRSGNVLIDPSTVDTDCRPTGSAYQCLIVYSQANGTIARPARCIQWRIQQDKLQTRWWLPKPAVKAATVTAWRNVAEGVVNLDTSPVTRSFTLDADPLKQGRSIEVLFLVGTGSTGVDGPVARVEASLTARNTSYGYLTDSCA